MEDNRKFEPLDNYKQIVNELEGQYMLKVLKPENRLHLHSVLELINVIIPNIPSLVRDNGMIVPVMCASFAYMLVTWLYLINSNIGEVVPWKFGNFSSLI